MFKFFKKQEIEQELPEIPKLKEKVVNKENLKIFVDYAKKIYSHYAKNEFLAYKDFAEIIIFIDKPYPNTDEESYKNSRLFRKVTIEIKGKKWLSPQIFVPSASIKEQINYLKEAIKIIEFLADVWEKMFGEAPEMPVFI